MMLQILLLGGAVVTARLLDTPTPQMGWNSYNYFNCYPNESIITDAATGLADSGLADLGYVYLTVDCGWPSAERDAQDRMVWNPELFPSGVEALAEAIHSAGLKFGAYSGGGFGQCGNGTLPASLGYEAIDAQSFAEWGADSLKYDNCFATNRVDMVDYWHPEYASPERFNDMAAEIDAVDRDILYQVCQWGCGTDLGEWAPPISNSYRIGNDIFNSWRAIWRTLNQAIPYAEHTGPGSFPDMDMLVVGVAGFTPTEERFHFSLWSILKSPLILGMPFPASPTDPSIAIVSNPEVIAINQDSLAAPATLRRRYTEEEYDIFAGPLSGDRYVLALVNWNGDAQTVSVNLEEVLGVVGANARDVWAEADFEIGGVYEAALEGHELRLLVLSDVVESEVGEPVSTGYHAAQDAVLSGARVVECPADECLPVGAKIGDVTAGSSITFSSVSASSAGTKLVAVDYVNYDIAMETAWDWGSNTRNMTIAVNGEQAKRWAFPLAGLDWYESGRLLVEVDGFEAGENEVVFRGYGDQWAPDLIGFEVLEYA